MEDVAMDVCFLSEVSFGPGWLAGAELVGSPRRPYESSVLNHFQELRSLLNAKVLGINPASNPTQPVPFLETRKRNGTTGPRRNWKSETRRPFVLPSMINKKYSIPNFQYPSQLLKIGH
jgi:hypothetical protein